MFQASLLCLGYHTSSLTLFPTWPWAAVWHTCYFAPRAPSWLTVLQGDSGHRQGPSWLSLIGTILQHLSCPHILLHRLQGLPPCAFSLVLQTYAPQSSCSTASRCFKLCQLEKLQRNKKCPGDTVRTMGSRVDLGQGRAGWPPRTHLRGVSPEHSHTNPALGLLLLHSTEGETVYRLHGEM